MQQVVAFADGRQQAARARQRGVGQRRPRRVVEGGLAKVGKAEEVAEVVVAAALHQLLVADAGFLHQRPQGLPGHGRVEQQAGRKAGGALGQAAADFSHQVARYFLFDVQLGVARELHGAHRHLRVGRKQAGGPHPNHVVQKQHEPLLAFVGQAHETAAVPLGGQLHHQHPLGLGAFGLARLAEKKSEVNGLVLQKQVVQGVVQRHGREQVAHFVLEVLAYPGALPGAQPGLVQQVDAVGVQGGQQLFPERGPELLLLPKHLGQHLAQLPLGAVGELGPGFLFQLHQPPQRGHPHLEKLVEVAAENGQELEPLQQRHGRALGLLQYAGVEAQPAQVAG